MDSIKISAPATVSNVGPGFDLMGFALDNPSDVMIIRKNKLDKLRIVNRSGVNLPEDPSKNVASVAALSLLRNLGENEGFDLVFETKINPGSGIGSSAASCTAAVFGISEMLGIKSDQNELIHHALQGEFLASGSIHADNIAPALLGGFVLIRSYEPLDIIRIPAPPKLLCIIAHPEIEIKTSESRKLLPTSISLNDSLCQTGNAAALVAGLLTSDLSLIGRSLKDRIAEPVRMKLIPGYMELKEQLPLSGILGMNISGSGPSIFAFADNRNAAEKAEMKMISVFRSLSIPCKTYISGISESGTKIKE